MILFFGGMLLLLLLSVWIFYYHKRVIKEEFDILEAFDPDQNISSEPSELTGTDNKDSGITGLKLTSSDPKDIMRYVNTIMGNVLQINSAGQIPGKTGPRGMRGEPGANGGKYQRVGALYNQKYPDKYISRAAGIGPGAILYTEPTSSKQWQQWQLDENNKLRSVYNPNECISQKDGKLYMDACISTDQQWQHRRTNGAIMTKFPVKGKHLCFSLKPVSSYPSNGPISSSGKKGSSGKNISNTDVVVLEPCSNSKEEQQWQWS